MKKLYSAILASLVSYQASAIDLPELSTVEQEVKLDASIVIEPQAILGTSSINDDWQPYTEINHSPVFKNPQSQHKGSSLMSAKAAQTTCYNATENYAVYNSIANVGDRTCFILDLASKTKLEGYAANQPAGVNYDLGLYRYENNQFTLLDSSANAVGNDHTVAVVRGDMYLL